MVKVGLGKAGLVQISPACRRGNCLGARWTRKHGKVRMPHAIRHQKKMLDIQLLRKDLPAAVAGLKRRGYAFDEAGFRELEEERRELQMRTEELQAKRNALSKQI